MSLINEDDKRALGAFGGTTAGLITGAKAGLAVAPVAGPFAPIVIGLFSLGGALFGGIAGHRNPAGAAVACLGVIGAEGYSDAPRKPKEA